MPDETGPRTIDPVSAAIGEHGARLTAVESGQRRLQGELAGVRNHLDRQDAAVAALDAKVDRALSAMHARVEALDATIGAGFAGLGARLDAVAPHLARVDGLLAEAQAARARRLRWAAWLDALAAPLLSALTVVLGGLLLFAFTHPRGGLPDPDMAPFLAVVGVPLAALLTWSAYRKVHRAEAPDLDQPDGGPAPHAQHPIPHG